MARHCTCKGTEDSDPCAYCARRISLAEAMVPDRDDWMTSQDRYERWLDRIAP